MEEEVAAVEPLTRRQAFCLLQTAQAAEELIEAALVHGERLPSEEFRKLIFNMELLQREKPGSIEAYFDWAEDFYDPERT